MESTEIQLARLDERMKMLLDHVEKSHESQDVTRAWMGKVDRSLVEMSTRVRNVENSIAKSAPTIEEFIAIKQKVIGAGIAGRWLWLGLGSLLGMVIATKGQLLRFFSGGT